MEGSDRSGFRLRGGAELVHADFVHGSVCGRWLTGMGMGAEIVYVVVARSLCVVGGSDGK